jgi:hypothetical protein
MLKLHFNKLGLCQIKKSNRKVPRNTKINISWSVLIVYLCTIDSLRPVEVQNCKIIVRTQEAKYIERWPSTTSAWAGWSRFDIPVDRYGGVHSLLWWPSRALGSPTCH